MKPAVGDWVMSVPTEEYKGLYTRAILLTGSEHTHDEMVGDQSGQLVVGDARLPTFEFVPFAQREGEVERGERVMAVFRWREFCSVVSDAEHRRFQTLVNMGLRMMDGMPYDVQAIKSHGRNWIRARLRWIFPWLGDVVAQKEFEVYCTESCFKIFRCADYIMKKVRFNLDEKIKYQPLVAPIHAERLVRDGWLVCVKDYGLMEKLQV